MMLYRIEFVQSAKNDLHLLRKTDQVKVLDRIERHLTYDPRRQSRSRIKRLRTKTIPPYRLRVGDFRIYYDVDEQNRVVIVYGVVPKEQSETWLEQSTQEHEKED